MKILIKTSFFLVILLLGSCKERSSTSDKVGEIIPNQWMQFNTVDEDGLLGERIDLWRNNRLWNIAESGFLIDGFENRPGTHVWQGEHIGKWLHAATLAYNVTGDEKLKEKLDEMVERLIATQLPDGYLGTYDEEDRFMNVMNTTDTKLLEGRWDTWTFRYNIYGLLTYEKYFPNDEVVDACKKMADLLIQTYGTKKADLTEYGSREGISSTTLLESIMMLYERTLDQTYLDFAEEIVAMSENNPSLRLMGTMLKGGSVVHPGNGKAYQLMANLLGYLRLYRYTGNEKYLKTVTLAWEDIYDNHLLVNGGPWSRKMPYNANRECFAYTEAFNPERIDVEGCSGATWIQLNTHLFELTGHAKYFNEAEITLINDIYQHQHIDGIQWCYYTKPNEERPPYNPRYHCCGSSMPRVLEMYSSHLAGEIGDILSVNTLFPSTIQLTKKFGGGTLKIEGAFPLESSATIKFETVKKKNFTLEFRIPANSSLASVTVNGESTKTQTNERGFAELTGKWQKGDVVSIDMDYTLKAHRQSGEEGGKWIAFTYGPLALAQRINKMPDDEPFINLDSDEHSEIIKMLSKSPASETEFTIKGTDISLIPYYQTGSDTTGSRTYFKL
jgi:uncharacterized protein